MVTLTRLLFSLWQLWVVLKADAYRLPDPDQNRLPVKLDRATITGIIDGSVESFLGVPYAQPP